MTKRLQQMLHTAFNLVGVRAKIVGIAMLLVLVLGVLLIWQVQNSFNAVLRQDLTKQGVSMGYYLAARSENLLLTNNIYALNELVRDTMKNNPEIKYILISNSQGELVMNSFGRKLPRGLHDFNSVGNEEYSRKIFVSGDGLVQDVAVPILGGKIGEIRVGLSEAGIAGVVGGLQQSLWLSTAIISLMGILLAYTMASVINRPLKELVTATNKIGEGELDHRVPLAWAKDELGQLAAAFNEMAKRLQHNEEERKRLWQEVVRREEMRRNLLSKVISAQEEERLRISRELHDETGQALSSVNMALASLNGVDEPEEFRQRVRLMQDTVKNALEDIHMLSRQLRPSVLDKLGLAAAIQRLIINCSQHWGKEIGLTITGFNSGEDISEEVKITAYRIIQEALGNALRHCQGENISVVMQKFEQKILLIIEDDGVGFDLSEFQDRTMNDRHLGLFGMQERADILGGTFSIETAPGEGTTIYVELPLIGGVEYGAGQNTGIVGG